MVVIPMIWTSCSVRKRQRTSRNDGLWLRVARIPRAKTQSRSGSRRRVSVGPHCLTDERCEGRCWPSWVCSRNDCWSPFGCRHELNPCISPWQGDRWDRDFNGLVDLEAAKGPERTRKDLRGPGRITSFLPHAGGDYLMLGEAERSLCAAAVGIRAWRIMTWRTTPSQPAMCVRGALPPPRMHFTSGKLLARFAF
jgi:hypothetical protein